MKVDIQIENKKVIITQKGNGYGCGLSFNLEEITLKQITFLLWSKIKCNLK